MENWNHAELRVDNERIIKPGNLAVLDFNRTVGYYKVTGDKFKSGLENWVQLPDRVREEFNNENPIVMILDLNIEETYYKITLGEQFVWISFGALKSV